MQEEIMLRQAAAISEKYELLRKETGSNFNIFEIANIATNEVKICRVIYELLSPLGCHYQGSIYLKLFMEKVLGIENVDEAELKSAKVYRERVIKNDRRIDLLIETDKRMIPIEVKIYAKEQSDQCYDYYDYVVKFNKKITPQLFYLTRFGNEPSSAGGLTCSDDKHSSSNIICISFAQDILRWLELCLKETETWKLAPIREVLAQLMLTIRRFTGQMEDREMKELISLLRTSSTFMHGADKMQGAIPEAKKALMMDLFDAIAGKVKDELGEKEQNRSLWYYKDCIDGYYKCDKSTWPGINFFYKHHEASKSDIWVRLEIDHKMFVGYANTIDGQHTPNVVGEDLTKSLVQKIKDGESGGEKSWWIAWKYITLVYPESPDFKNHNEAFYALFDKKYFDEYAEECAKAIVEMLKE